MSLQIDDRGRRGRSRSPGGRDDRDRSRTRPDIVDAVPYPSSTGAFRDPAPASYEYERVPKWPTPAAPARSDSGSDSDDAYYRGSRDKPPAEPPRYGGDPRRAEKERDRDSDREREQARQRVAMFLPQKYAAQIKTAEPPGESARQSRESLKESDRERKEREKERRKSKYDDDLAYGSIPGPSKSSRPASPPSAYGGYAQPKPWEYARPEEQLTYGGAAAGLSAPGRPGGRSPSPGPPRRSPNPYSSDPRTSASVLTVEPGGAAPRKSAMKRGTSPLPPVGRMSSLTLQTGHHTASLSLASAPGSPLLESYHGTYQSMSPMPSPMLLPSQGSGSLQILDVFSPIGSDDERSSDKKRSRRARFHDPVDDAARLAKALKGEKRAPETEPLIEILPGLTHEQVMELRVEYKRLVKTGTERKGVNIAKHIRARLKDEDPNLMKACYATALGRWESEAYWANFWYHGDKTRRELLIESLMGRTNDEIRAIRNGFSDKKYGDSLSRCMKTELKEDKFKKAVLMVLDEARMEERDGYGRPLRIDYELVADDVKQLHHAVRSEKGGESLMISIVIQRSDSHLREVLRIYKETYRGANFAKDALKKSGNLVGEVLTHILNGVINKPVRDAMLLHHALTASKRDGLRRELLISRLVRYHWDGAHMALVKQAYREHYGKDLQEAVKEATSGELGEFCRALCITRMPDDTKTIAARADANSR
ncbi:hypothetical protein B0T22DRAFT_52148 [Podospora appendiculata]|uniref:Annexin n=1 Tax=Podospora appendiculata TaxID=314037 RepID=A0AAE1CGL4_9PEZI|nr:hypothetical protein B0T22DRAFT_52148 [Podospora appendiculata]